MRILSRRDGFSLIELLTVIAIIAILAAIIFPVMNSVKAKGVETKCMTNMKSLASAVKMYKLDNRKYPNRLGPIFDPSNPVPFDAYVGKPTPGCVMGDQIKAAAGFRCPASRHTNYNASVRVTGPLGTINGLYYLVDDYDMFATKVSEDPATPGEGELRYATQWAQNPAGVDAFASDGGTADDDFQRQLFRRNCPEDTVVTWCSFHNNGDKGIVLFLDGTTRAFDSKKVNDCKWRIRPPKL